MERQVTRIRSLSTWSHTHTHSRETAWHPLPHPLTTEPVLSGTLVGRAGSGGQAGSSQSGWRQLAAVGCSVPRHTGKSTRLHTHPSAHPPLTAPRSPGEHGRAASGSRWPGVWYSQCPNPVLPMQDLIRQCFLKKTSESNLDDAGQPVWDLGFVSVSMGVCSSYPADQRHCWSESCALSPSAQGGASLSLSCQRGGGPGPRPRRPQESASMSPSAGATLWYPHPPISLSFSKVSGLFKS